MHKFPETVSLTFVDSKTNRPIENLAVFMTLYAKEKNDYTVGPQFTNSRGVVLFSRDDVIREIELSKKMFIMDYKSDLDESSDLLCIKTFSKKQIEEFIIVRSQFGEVMPKLKLQDESVRKLQSASNYIYIPVKKNFLLDDLRKPKQIELIQITD